MAELVRIAPPGWTLVRCEFAFDLTSPVTATATTAAGDTVALKAPNQVIHLLGQQHAHDARAGWPWQRLIVERSADGQLSVSTAAS